MLTPLLWNPIFNKYSCAENHIIQTYLVQRLCLSVPSTLSYKIPFAPNPSASSSVITAHLCNPCCFYKSVLPLHKLFDALLCCYVCSSSSTTVVVVLETWFVPCSDADDRRTVTCSGDGQPARSRSSDVYPPPARSCWSCTKLATTLFCNSVISVSPIGHISPHRIIEGRSTQLVWAFYGFLQSLQVKAGKSL